MKALAICMACLWLLGGCTSAEAPQQAVQAVDLPACTQPRPIVDRLYIAFFERHSAVLQGRASLIVEEFARYYQIEHGNYVILTGNTDMAETGRRDRMLGRRRAEAVADRLAQLGLRRDTIIVRDAEATRPLVPTPPGVSEPQNRRVGFFYDLSGSDADRAKRRNCLDWLSKTYCDMSAAQAISKLCKQALDNLKYLP